MSGDVNTTAPKSLDDLAPKMELRGKIKRLELYGAFVDIGIGQDALLHISQLGKPNVRNVGDIVKEGEEVTVYVLKVDKAAGRVALSLVEPPGMSWDDIKEGSIVTGKVVRVESFGIFVDIGAERPGMVHVSELASGFINSPSDVAKMGDEVQARIIKINRKKRQIDMSMKSLEEPMPTTFDDEEDDRNLPTAMELALREAMEGKQDARERHDRKRSKQNRREDQDDIISRTLRNHSS